MAQGCKGISITVVGRLSILIKNGNVLVVVNVEENSLIQTFTKNMRTFAVFILAFNGDKVIATSREGQSGFGLPGGKVDQNESDKDAALREAKEEGWDFKKSELLEFYTDMVEGRLVKWFYAEAVPIKLTQYKEKHRGIIPVEVTVHELINSNPAFKNKEAIEAYNRWKNSTF